MNITFSMFREVERRLFVLFLLFVGLINMKAQNASYIPLDKGLDMDWVNSLSGKGERKIYSEGALKYIAMPCGGIGTGQVEITGEGKLCFTESVYNQRQQPNAGFGFSNGYQYLNPQKPVSKVENSFSISIQTGKSQTKVYQLDNRDFDDIQFVGEYPLAYIKYGKTKEALPVEINSEVFSPFVPLDLRKSANPVTVLKFSVKNISQNRIRVSLSGQLRNIVFPEVSKVTYLNSEIKTSKLSGIAFNMRPKDDTDELDTHPQLGGFSLCVLDKNAKKTFTVHSTAEPSIGIVNSELVLNPNETKDVTFLISWYFPNLIETAWDGVVGDKNEAPGLVGHIYNNWYTNSEEVAEYVAANFDDLYGTTKLFRETYNDNTLPYWLSNRITMSLSTLAAGNISIWQNGRMYAYEGIGFCPGTCGHVYNFVTAISKLFPSLERSVRILQDFNDSVAYSPMGRINFRGFLGANSRAGHSYASDAQSGYVLKVYREHLMSPDFSFLNSVWDKVKMAIGYQIFKDGAEIGLEPNGVLEGKQTFWDPMWYGPNPYNNTLYLAALRAAEEMAILEGEIQLARRYHQIFELGQKYMNEKMWNGEFYVHLYPVGFNGNTGSWNGFREPEEIDANAKGYIDSFNEGKPNYLMGGGCDAQQLFGQNWATQLGLGDILPADRCELAAKSIFNYCWTPDISTVYNFQKPHHRTLADQGEGAMVNAGWPNEEPKAYENTHDKTDVWTGLEYEAACDMINAGKIEEALVVLRAVDDRYDGVKRNPWNEVEGSDHYSRAMHAWNVLLSLSGFTYNGPAGEIGFSPKLTPENFKCFFSVAEGWGTIQQKQMLGRQTNEITLNWGELLLKQLTINIPVSEKIKRIKMYLDSKELNLSYKQINNQVYCNLLENLYMTQGQSLKVVAEY